jgi:hypothetical protein
VTDLGYDRIRITFTPTLAEHLREAGAGAGARIIDPRGLLPWFAALSLLFDATRDDNR